MGKNPGARRKQRQRPPQQARSKETVAAILQAADRLLHREGAEALTTKRVAQVAGVSIGTLYQYFPDRESIILEIEKTSWSTLLNQMQSVVIDVVHPDKTLGGIIFEITERMANLVAIRMQTYGWTADLDPEEHAQRAGVRAAATNVLVMALEPYRERLHVTDLRLASVIILESVINLMRIGVKDHPDDVASGALPKEIAALVTRHLVKIPSLSTTA